MNTLVILDKGCGSKHSKITVVSDNTGLTTKRQVPDAIKAFHSHCNKSVKYASRTCSYLTIRTHPLYRTTFGRGKEMCTLTVEYFEDRKKGSSGE